MIASFLSEWAIVAGQLTAIAVCATILARLLWAAMKFFRKMGTAATIIVHEFVPNGGSTMRDAIDRIEDRLCNLESFVDEVKAERE